MRRIEFLLIALLAACGVGAAYWQGGSFVIEDQNSTWGSCYFDLVGISAPANPAAGTRRLFVDSSTGEMSVRTSGGTTVSLEGGGGGGGVASRSVFGPWTKVNVPASGSDLTFDMPTSAILPAGQANIRMPFAGKVVGISASMSAARTGGTATFEVFKNGAALTGTPTCAINATDTQRAYGASGTGTFVAGDDIEVRVDMAGTYAPTTSEAAVYVTVEWTN